jgi:hypothetical protein
MKSHEDLRNLPALIDKSVSASVTNKLPQSGQTQFVSYPLDYRQDTSPIKDTDTMPRMSGTTKQAGTLYVPSWLPNYSYVSWLQMHQELTSQKLFNLMGHWAFRKVLNKQLNMIFTETQDNPIRIEVERRDGKKDAKTEELEKHLEDMMFDQRVDLVSRMRAGFSDCFSHGMSILTWKWTRVKGGKFGNELVLEQLTRLPVQSFDYPPIGQPLVFSPIMQGVTLHRDETTGLNTGELEFWQRISVFNFVPIQLETKNLFWIRDPLGIELAGDPICRPIVPIVEMISYSMNAHMQVMNRTGAPWFFIKIDNPQDACAANSYVSDIDYAGTILQNASKDNRYILRPNFTIEPVQFGSTDAGIDVAMRTVEMLNQIIVDVYTPKEAVTQNKGSTLGGNQNSAENLFYAYIQAMQGWISHEYSRIPQMWLDANGFGKEREDGGYIARVMFPVPQMEKSDIRAKQALIGAEMGIIDPIQFCEKLEIEIDTEGDPKATLMDNSKFWGEVYKNIGKTAAGAPGAPGAPGMDGGAGVGSGAEKPPQGAGKPPQGQPGEPGPGQPGQRGQPQPGEPSIRNPRSALAAIALNKIDPTKLPSGHFDAESIHAPGISVNKLVKDATTALDADQTAFVGRIEAILKRRGL